jgi:6-pyruvoyltetrahydropterin/6-carboxytetrahydropterin synthase
MSLVLERTYRFSAAHRYHRPEWSEEENFAKFGRCSWAPGHGHNYRLTIRVGGEIDAATGFLVDLAALDRAVGESVLDRLDHRQIDHAIAEFAPGKAVPTSENLVLWIRDRLREALPTSALLLSVRLAEDDDLAAEWRAEREAPERAGPS